jgi:hypothetical protein
MATLGDPNQYEAAGVVLLLVYLLVPAAALALALGAGRLLRRRLRVGTKVRGVERPLCACAPG